MTNYVVQFSGGLGSFAAAHWVKQNRPGNVTLLFCDTRTEDEDLYRFLIDTSRFLELPLTTIADGRNVWEILKWKRFIGNSRVDPCSRILKRELSKAWVDANFGSGNCTLVFGIDWTESHRVSNVHSYWRGYSCLFPLVDEWRYDKHEFAKYVESIGIKLPRLYSMGFPHNNCGGFCIKAGKAHFLRLLEKLPERYRYHEQREAEMQDLLGKPYTILREQVGGVKRYISLRELRQRAEEISATEDGQLDWGGCGCFNDIGSDEIFSIEEER